MTCSRISDDSQSRAVVSAASLGQRADTKMGAAAAIGSPHRDGGEYNETDAFLVRAVDWYSRDCAHAAERVMTVLTDNKRM